MQDIDIIANIEKKIHLKLTENQFSRAFYRTIKNRIYQVTFQDIELNLKNIIDDLEQLKYLKTLQINNCSLSSILGIERLTQLENLELIDNNIRNLHRLYKLTNLKKLNFSENHVRNISFVSGLNKLKDLWFWGNQVQDIRPISTLINLTELGLGKNKVNSKDFKHLSKLEKLKVLQLSESSINDLSHIPHIPSLKVLWLNDNDISDISTLNAFKKIECIYLQNNAIEELPNWLLESRLPIDMESHVGMATTGVCLQYNPIKKPPLEIIKQGKEAILAWSKGERAYINEAKVLLVGHGEVGKTTLVKCLTGNTPDPNESATHNIKIKTAEIKYNEKDIKLNYWDFGGQEVMHSTHQFFLSKRSIYILVLDGRRDEDAEYWLKHIESFGGNSPVLVVMNKIDANPAYDVNRQFLQKKYPFIIGFHKTVCKPGDIRGIDELKNGILVALDNIELLKQEWPNAWLRVKKRLEESSENIMSQNEFEKICLDEQIKNGETREILADYLNDLGIIVHFKEIKLSDLHILQPRWASRAAYKIINCKKVADANGLLDIRWMVEIMKREDDLDFEYHSSTFNYILELLQKFELCYPLNDGKQYLIPELMGVQQPDLPILSSPVLKFYFQYDGLLPRSILPRFIVRMHEDIYKDFHWRTGVVLTIPIFKSTAIIISDVKEKRISISVSGLHNREHFAIIRKTFHDLHKTFEKLNVTEWIPLPGENYAIEYDELTGYEEAGKTDYFVGKLKRTYNVTELLNGIEMESERKEEYKWEVFICHSSKDKQIIREIVKDLKQLKISYWLDEERIDPGDNIIDTITDGLQNSRFIIPCLSTNQLNSGWTRKEYQSILTKIISGLSDQRIIPLIIDDIADNKVPLFLGDIRIERYQDKDQYNRLIQYLTKGNKKKPTGK